MGLTTKLLNLVKKIVVLVLLFFSVQTWALNDSIVYAELKKLLIAYPLIVLAQAKLETGNYTSKLCKKHNNLFGLNSRKGYRKYSDWKESVTDYKKLILSKYKGGDYYEFLKRVGYASDKKYIVKLKKLVKK